MNLTKAGLWPVSEGGKFPERKGVIKHLPKHIYSSTSFLISFRLALADRRVQFSCASEECRQHPLPEL